jgi:2-dehydropantoate 2-reductase
MKILIYGAGIIGSTYGWQLSKAGHDVTVLVRQGKKQQVVENGITIHCSDFRSGQKQIEQIVFRPNVIEELTPENDFEYIFVSTNCLHLKEVLPVLSSSAGKANILFFQNMWDDFDEISKYLSPQQYFFGFPFMVGGGRDDKSIYSAVSGLKQSSTPLGELNGEVTPRVQKLAKAFEEANLKPQISQQIKTWLITHYAVAGALSGGIMKAGSGKAFAQNSVIIRETIKAIREGFNVCSSRNINPKTEKANKPYYLPLFFIIPILKKIYGSESLCLMFNGHTKHSPDEMKKMLEDIIEYGERGKVKMPYLKRLQKDIT